MFLPQGRWEACQSCRGTLMLSVMCYFSQLCRHQDYWTQHKLITFLEGKRDASQKDEPPSARVTLSWSIKEQAVQSHLQRRLQCTATVWRCLEWSTENISLQSALSLSSAFTGQGTHRVRKKRRGLRRGWWVGGSQREQWSMPQGTFSPYMQSETQQHLQTEYCCNSTLCAALLFVYILLLKQSIRPSSTGGLLFSPDSSIILKQGEENLGGWAKKRKLKKNFKRYALREAGKDQGPRSRDRISVKGGKAANLTSRVVTLRHAPIRSM